VGKAAGLGVACAAGLVALAGCGGKETARLGPAALRAQASRICSQADAQRLVQQLEALRPPARLESAYAHLLAAEVNIQQTTEQLHEAVAKGDREQVATLQIALAIAKGKATGYARLLGTTACGTMP
jgi:hypothetical protein